MKTDSRLQNAIEDSLKRDAELDARRIDVATNNRAVALSSDVSSWAEHNEAVRAAFRVLDARW